MRFIDTGFNTPSMNMAIDEALLDSKEPVLRFYQWNPPGLSIGYFQNINQINLNNLKNIQLVRRLTGGNAVLHDKELTYSFIIDESKMPKSVIESYKIISQGLLNGLKLLNLNPTMNPVKETPKSPICFQDPSHYEILINNKKIIGSAQKRTKGKILQHGSILLDLDIERYADIFTNKPDINKLKQRIITLKELTNINIDKLKKAIKAGFKKDYNLTNSQLTKEELNKAKLLEKNYLSSL